MKRIITTAAAMLIACPALAQQTTSDAASKAAASARVGATTTIFEGSRIPNNTPDLVMQAQPMSNNDCPIQKQGFSFAAVFAGLGGGLGVPGETSETCEILKLAEFNSIVAREMRNKGDQRGAAQKQHTADELMCQHPRMKATSACVAPQLVTVYQPTTVYQPMNAYYYCRNPAGYYPAVQGCARWETVGPR